MAIIQENSIDYLSYKAREYEVNLLDITFLPSNDSLMILKHICSSYNVRGYKSRIFPGYHKIDLYNITPEISDYIIKFIFRNFIDFRLDRDDCCIYFMVNKED